MPMTQNPLLLLSLWSITVAVVSATLPARTPTERPTARPSFSCGNDPLSCYLNSIIIPIPDTCIEFNKLQLCITGFECDGIFLSGVPSAYKAPTTLGVGMNGVGTNCHGNYKYGLASGTASAIITNTDLYVDLLVNTDKNFPVSTEFSTCNISSMDVDIEFSGTVLEDLSGPLERVVKRAVDRLVCVNLAEFVAVNVTRYIDKVLDPNLKTIIASEPSEIPDYSSDYINWHNSIVSKIHTLVDTVEVNPDGQILQCIVQQAPDIVHSFIENRVKSFLQSPAGSSGEIVVDFTNLPMGMEVPSFSLSAMGLDASVSVSSLLITGLRTVNNVAIMEPMDSSNATLHTELDFDYLELDMGLNLYITDGTGGSYNETSLVHAKVSKVSIIADLTLAIDHYILDNFYLDQLSSPGCWLATISAANFPNMQLSLVLDEVSITPVHGDAGTLEKNIADLINNAMLLVIDGFGELTTEVIDGLVQGPLRAGLNTLISDNLAASKEENECLTHYPYENSKDYVVWANSTLISAVSSLVHAVGYQGLNALMDCVTGGTGIFNLNVSKLAISIGGLNSFYELDILAPWPSGDESQKYDLYNQIGIGACPDEDSCNPLQISIASNGYEFEEVVGQGNEDMGAFMSTAFNDFKISLSFENLRLYLDLFWKVDENAMKDLQFEQVRTKGCVASTYAGLAISNWSLSVGEANVIIDDGEKMRNATQGINKIFSLLTSDSRREQKNADIADELALSQETCDNGGVVPSSGSDSNGNGSSSNGQEWKLEMFFLVIGCTLCLMGLVWAYHFWGRESKTNCLATGRDISTLEQLQKPLWDRLDCNNSLLFHEKIPSIIRWGIPLCCLGNMGLFLNSNLDPEAVSVMTQVIGPNTKSDPMAVFDFGLQSTVQDMWDAEVYPLAILIAIFSGAWPYIKLAVMFVSWVFPPGLLSVEKREWYLQMLDMLGKWSLIDFYVMVMFLCAFYCELHIGNNLIVEVTVLPRWGFYGFLLATMISLGLGHIILACHRLIVDPKIPQELDDKSEKQSLASFVYRFPIYEDDVTHADKDLHKIVTAPRSRATSRASVGSQGDRADRDSADAASSMSDVTNSLKSVGGNVNHKVPFVAVQMTTLGKAALVLLLLITILFVIASTFEETMAFEFKGLVGFMLHDKAEQGYSYVSIGEAAPKNSGLPPGDFAIHWVQASYYMFGLVMPLGLCLALLYVWFTPLSISGLREIFVLTEVLNAWNAIDVFCVSIAAALMEIQQFAAFIVGDSCDGINKILEKEFFDTLLDGDDKCFDVIATLKSASWLIFTCAGLLLLVGVPSLSICHFAIKSRMQAISQSMLDSVVGAVAASPKKRGSGSGGGSVFPADGENNAEGVVTASVGGNGVCKGEGDGALGVSSGSTNTSGPPHISPASESLVMSDGSGESTFSPLPPFSQKRNISLDDSSAEAGRTKSFEEVEANNLAEAVQTAAERYAAQSYWARCTLHNITVWFVYALAFCKLVTLEETLQTKGMSFSSLTPKQQRRARVMLQQGFANSSALIPLLVSAAAEEDYDHVDGAEDAASAMPTAGEAQADAENSLFHGDIYEHKSSFGSSPQPALSER